MSNVDASIDILGVQKQLMKGTFNKCKSVW